MIDCYEPHPGTFKLLERTFPGHEVDVELHRQGVSDVAQRVKIYSGPNNIGESSIVMQHKGTKQFTIDVMGANDLPEADILKMDTEGCEALIVRALSESGRLGKFSAVMMETHGPADQDFIMAKMKEAGFTVTKKNQWHANRCELCYVRSDLLPKDFKAVGPRKVLLATPIRGGISGPYLAAFTTILTANWDGRFKIEPLLPTGGSVATARNIAASYALTHGFDDLFFWDKDLHTEDPQVLLSMFNRMLMHDVDFVAGQYCAHTKATYFHGCRVKGEEVDDRGLLPMVQMPIGFAKIRVSVLKKIMRKYPMRYYSVAESGGERRDGLYDFFPDGLIGPNTPQGKIERIAKLFDTQYLTSVNPFLTANLLSDIKRVIEDMDISETHYVGEDYQFCELARTSGVQMFLDTQFIVPHEEVVRTPIPTAQLASWMAEEWRQPQKPKKKGLLRKLRLRK
jgi:FkbM family methyltransferase